MVDEPELVQDVSDAHDKVSVETFKLLFFNQAFTSLFFCNSSTWLLWQIIWILAAGSSFQLPLLTWIFDVGPDGIDSAFVKRSLLMLNDEVLKIRENIS